MLQTRALSKFNLSYWLRYCVYLEQWFEGVFLLPWRPNTCAVCAHSSCVQNKTINMWAAPAITFLTQSKARRGLTGLLPAKSNLISKQGWSVTPNSALTTKVGEKKASAELCTPVKNLRYFWFHPHAEYCCFPDLVVCVAGVAPASLWLLEDECSRCAVCACASYLPLFFHLSHSFPVCHYNVWSGRPCDSLEIGSSRSGAPCHRSTWFYPLGCL